MSLPRIASDRLQLRGSQLVCHLPPQWGGGYAQQLNMESGWLGLLPWQGPPGPPIHWTRCESPFPGRRQSHCLPSDKKCGLIGFLFLRTCPAQGQCLQDRKSREQGKGCAGPTLPPAPPSRLPSPLAPGPSHGRGAQLRQKTRARPPPHPRASGQPPMQDPRPWPVGGRQPPCHPAAWPANPG